MARFTGNPHVVAPSRRDLELQHQPKSETFPIPLPSYLPRSASLPPTTSPIANPKASHAGHFTMSLRGARKNLRRAGPHTQALVRAVEDALIAWMAEGAIVLSPDAPPPPISFPGTLIGGIEGVHEVQRMHEVLVLWIEDDAWSRYVVHCCARYHGIVSFSKDTQTHRLTHLLRPNPTRPSTIRQEVPIYATPPTTDPELSSHSSYDSDSIALSDIPSSAELSDIASDAGDPPPLSGVSLNTVSDNDADAESDLGSIASLYNSVRRTGIWESTQSETEELTDATRLLSIDEETPRARRVAPLRASAWDRARSGSSPSRSPARRERRHLRRSQRHAKAAHIKETGNATKSFYHYLFD